MGKIDLQENSNAASAKLAEMKQRDSEMGKVQLRVDNRTVILVSPNKCNEKHAAMIREKFKKASKY